MRVKHLIREDFLSEALEIIFSYADDVLKSISYINACQYAHPFPPHHHHIIRVGSAIRT